MKKLLAILLPSIALIGCHAQVTPTSHSVTLSWTAPAASGSWTGCTSAAPCTYVVSRIAVSAGVTTCPAVNIATPNYTPLNPSSPTSAISFPDTAASGLTVCYIVQTEQAGNVSQPSNTAGPFVVPANPLAPSLTGNEARYEPSMMPTVGEQAPIQTASLRGEVR